ncbi:MAG: hypothetical protein HZLCBSQH_000476 [Candidatus Fervidibacterota bacterium]
MRGEFREKGGDKDVQVLKKIPAKKTKRGSVREAKGMRGKFLDRVLIVLIVALVIANGLLIGRNWLPQKSPSSPPKWWLEIIKTIQQKPFENDSPLGIEIDALKRFPGRRLVIVLDRCTECVLGTLKMWAEITKATGLPKMVVVTKDSLEEAKRILRQHGIDAEVVTDYQGSISQKLNAFAPPRAYAFESGRLVWKQVSLNLGRGTNLEVR